MASPWGPVLFVLFAGLLEARVNLDSMAPLLGGSEAYLQLHSPLLGQDEGRLQHQLLEVLGAYLAPGGEGKLAKGGAGQDRGLPDGVLGEPGVICQGEPAGQ
jgi:hypothetical protein